MPQPGRNVSLDNFCDTITNICNNLPNMSSRNNHNNLSPGEITALNELKNNKDIVIKVTDKGNSFCVLNKHFYIKKVNSLLSDSSHTYYKLAKNNDAIVFKNLKDLMVKYRECLNDHEFDFVTKFQWFSANFYAMPKCHKSNLIKSASLNSRSHIHITDPDDLQFRPIVGGPQSPTSRLSKLLDSILKPLVIHVHTNLKDETTFINTFPRDISDKNTGYFVNYDIKSMYTNITLELVLKSTYYWLTHFESTTKPIYSWSFIRESLIFLMKNNTFDFNNGHYIQMIGGAMGTMCMPTLGTLSVGYLEVTRLFPSLDIISNHLSDFVKKYLRRYQDDSFIFLPFSICHPDILLNALNNMDSSKHIQYETDYNESNLNFLSLSIYKENNITKFDVHYKQTDQHNYLEFSSCHPAHVKRAVPYNLARRLCQIIDDKSVLQSRLKELTSFLIKRNYPISLVNCGVKRASDIPQNELRSVEQTNDHKKTVNFSITHNPRNADIRSQVMSALIILKNNRRMKNVLNNVDIVWTYKQPISLKCLLSPSRMGPKIGEISKCNDTRCNICSMLIISQVVTFNNGSTHKISHKMSCNSILCIYALKCHKCQKFYIGECEELRARINLHVNQIKHKKYRKLNVSHHIFSCGSKFNVIPLFLMDSENIISRKIKEQYFISLYKPELNVD